MKISTCRRFCAHLTSFVLAAQVNDPEDGAAASAISKARDFIADHVLEPLSFIDIASEVGVSPHTLYVEFRKRYQMTPIQFLQRRRLELLSERLLDADPATEISTLAYDLGFTDLERLSVMYREAFWELPQETLRRKK